MTKRARMFLTPLTTVVAFLSVGVGQAMAAGGQAKNLGEKILDLGGAILIPVVFLIGGVAAISCYRDRDMGKVVGISIITVVIIAFLGASSDVEKLFKSGIDAII